MTAPTADVSVRLAEAADAAAVSGVQIRTWRDAYAGVLPAQVLQAMDVEQFTGHWRASLERPRDARNRVLVALERATVRGFAVTGPASDPDADPVRDGEIAELAVEPTARGQGHGSRLLQACVDTLRADRFTRATLWLNADADDPRRFVIAAGWAPDGANRELDLDGNGTVRVRQVRLHTDVRAP